MNFKFSVITAVCLLHLFAPTANADNQMGYRLLTPEATAALPHNRGSLGLTVDRAEQINDAGNVNGSAPRNVRRHKGSNRAWGSSTTWLLRNGLFFPSERQRTSECASS